MEINLFLRYTMLKPAYFHPNLAQNLPSFHDLLHVFSYSYLAKLRQQSARRSTLLYQCCCQHSCRSKLSEWIRSSSFLEICLPFHIKSQQKGCWLRLTLIWNEALSFPLKNNAYFRDVGPISIHLFCKCSEHVLSSHSPTGATFFQK